MLLPASPLTAPLAAFTAPENLLFPSGSNSRKPPARFAQFYGSGLCSPSNPLMADAVGTSENRGLEIAFWWGR